MKTKKNLKVNIPDSNKPIVQKENLPQILKASDIAMDIATTPLKANEEK